MQKLQDMILFLWLWKLQLVIKTVIIELGQWVNMSDKKINKSQILFYEGKCSACIFLVSEQHGLTLQRLYQPGSSIQFTFIYIVLKNNNSYLKTLLL